MSSDLTLKLITFLAAFLLFQIELIVAKLLLPVYGGSFFVWGACVVFFQAVLLLAYIFTHISIKKFGMDKHLIVFLFLISLPLISFPTRFIEFSSNLSQLPLGIDVFLRLLLSIGPVFFALSSVSLTTQMWSSSAVKSDKNPYSLYAVSNVGSFLALVSYPFLVEVLWDLKSQQSIWRIFYFIFIGLSIYAFGKIKVINRFSEDEIRTEKTPLLKKIIWFLLGAAPVMLFLAVTQVITYLILPIPLLWVIPLSIFLLSFVLNFKKKPFCPAWINQAVPLVIPLSALLFLVLLENKGFPVVIAFFSLLISLFLLCMHCQNQLVVLKPAPSQLTLFYVIISFGGFIGGVLTSWVLPLISKSFVEFILALLFITLTCLLKERIVQLRNRRFQLFTYSFLVILLSVLTVREIFIKNQTYIYKKRNYYGIYEILKRDGLLVFIHGTILHGAQILSQKYESEPSSFYSRNSPIGELLSTDFWQFRYIGVIGLGVGTLAIYTQPNQKIDFYELDPDVYRLAKKHFIFLSKAQGKVQVIFGDARRSLKQNSDKVYDLLVVDAFGGDAIPIHLVTKEAIEEYKSHLNNQGILAFHISNRYINLTPILSAIAKNLGAYYCFKSSDGNPYGIPSYWFIMTWSEPRFFFLVEKYRWQIVKYENPKQNRLWTDNYNSILPYINGLELKTRNIFQSFSFFIK